MGSRIKQVKVNGEGTISRSRTWQVALDAAVDRRFEEMVQLRRRLHRFPEVSGDERETSLLLYQRLDNEGFDVRMGPEGRGVLADFKNAVGEHQMALRADIDALRIHDAKKVEYRSQRAGIMHACGHDAHTALVFGALTALHDAQRQGALPVEINVRGIFQPAEETSGGARDMIRVGALEGVRAILATHMDPSRQIGTVGLRSGVLTAACDEMTITILGRGGHAARPHEASDPIAAAAQMINALYLFIARRTDSQDAVVVTIGQVIAGDNANVIPEEVVLRGTVRTLDRSVRQQTFDHIRNLAYGVGQTSDTTITVEYGLGSHSVVNDAELMNLLRRATIEVLGKSSVQAISRPSMGSEDFAYYLDSVPGGMLRIGCASERVGAAPLHSPEFDIDEQALCHGAKILAHAVVHWTMEQQGSVAGAALR